MLLKVLASPETGDPSLGSAHAITIDIECLTLLDKLPEAMETLHWRAWEETCRSTGQVLESGWFPPEDQRRLL